MCLLDNLTAFFGSNAASSYATDPDRGLWTAQPPGPRLTVTGLRVVTDARTRPLGSVTCILLLLSARAALKPAIWLRCEPVFSPRDFKTGRTDFPYAAFLPASMHARSHRPGRVTAQAGLTSS